MLKATAVEKRFFPWKDDRLVETLLNTAESLHWSDCKVTDTTVTAKAINQVTVGDSACPLEFTMNASWRSIGNDGVELVLSVSEENNSWSIIECKKKCTALADFLCCHLFPTNQRSDLTLH
ncbi:MAG TPA: hypothetical protein V6C69_03090 [Trichormus sp.]